MPLAPLFVVCLSILLFPAASAVPQKAPASASTVFVSTSAGPMLAVSRLLTEDTWNPILDQRVQQSPAASALGAAWVPSDPRWKKARAALGARMTRILEAYARSSEIPGHIQAELGRMGATGDVDATVTALTGPAGGALVRYQASKTYLVTAMTASPNGPAIGGPEWNAQMRDRTTRFNDRIGATMPPDDGSHVKELEKIVVSPVNEVLRRVWDFAVANATRQLKTAINLMLFDNQAAIERDIASAVGGR